MEILKCENVRKVYGSGNNQVVALDHIDLSVQKGEFVAIVGASGSGKSTLLHILGSVDKPTEGKVLIEGTELSAMNRTQAAIFRRRKVGLVYQFYNLIPTLTVRKNILMPLLLDKRKPNQEYFEQIIHSLGIEDKLESLPSQLSGGQQQRIGILRALAASPPIVLMDEPFSAIDAKLRKELQTRIKEIHEQPKAVSDTLNSVVKDGAIDLSEVGLSEEEIKEISQIYIVACGSAYHVGVAAQYVMEDLARIPVRVELASEFRYRNPILDPKGLVIIISQSGETADSLAALRESKKQGVKTLGIVNVIGSSIAREADNVFYTLAGPEIAVATTKAYSTQLIATYTLAIQFAKIRGQITEEQYTGYIEELKTIPDKISRIIEDKERLQWFASKQVNAKDIFFIGRGIDYAISLEGSLKMKEISYIHSEAYAAGELKHGTISLIEDGTLVIGVLTQPALYEKTLSNMVECKSRGAYLMGLTTFGHYNIEENADFSVYIPKTDPHFATSLAVIPLQLLGYYVSVAKGLDVDKPRNLAKSVTVE